LRLATWNVNSLRVRLAQVLDWLAVQRPDLLALQETKLPDEEFPLDAVQAAGYQAVFAGQKAYNGVAILSRAAPADVLMDLPGLDDPQRRVLAASFPGLRLVNLYVPNGAEVGTEKYEYKLRWLERLTEHLAGELRRHPRLVVVGDFNIAPEDRDVHDPELWRGRILCSEPEREAFRRLLDLGLWDLFRAHESGAGHFSWWDYRGAGFRRNLGLRIDHVLASGQVCARCTGCRIDRAPRRLERPSDHAPVVADLAD
jgi:exodeoxyribonuclease-3